jgi:hypothetical protein
METDRQFARRLALAWADKRAKEYIAQLEAVAEAAQTVVENGKPENLIVLKERLDALGKLENGELTNK